MMTEEEKKSAYEAAKTRISKTAIKLAAVASLASPNAAAAQNMAESPSGIETTLTVTTAPSSTIITNLEDIQTMPVLGCDELLKIEMLADRTEHDKKRAALEEQNLTEQEKKLAQWNEETLSEYNKAKKEAPRTWLQPCSNTTEASRIGNWNSTSVECSGYKSKKLKNIPSSPDKLKNKESISRENALFDQLASYNPSDGKITVPIYSERAQQYAAESIKRDGSNFKDEYKVNNVIAQNAVFMHEQNHKVDEEYNGQALLMNSPVNAAKSDRLTETKSHAVSYLNVAQQYTMMKEQGIQTIQINGENKPLESILEMYNGLKEVVLEKGFDINDPQSIRNVVEAASIDWHKNKADYLNQDINQAAIASINFGNLPMSEKLEVLKNEDATYAEVSQKMLKNTYIGHNTIVDLSSCQDLLDTMDKNEFIHDVREKQSNFGFLAHSEAHNKINFISYEELSAVNAHLENKGLLKDEDKDKYLKQAFADIAQRSENQDAELKKILLGYSPDIVYADGIYETTQGDMRIIGKKMKQYAMSDEMLAQANERQQQTKGSETPTIFAPAEMGEMPTITLGALNREDISNNMQQDRAAHDVELNDQIASLTQPSSRQSNTAGNTLTLQMMKQQQAAR